MEVKRRWSGTEFWPREAFRRGPKRLCLSGFSDSPSPLNGERARVRGETVRIITESDNQHFKGPTSSHAILSSFSQGRIDLSRCRNPERRTFARGRFVREWLIFKGWLVIGPVLAFS